MTDKSGTQLVESCLLFKCNLNIGPKFISYLNGYLVTGRETWHLKLGILDSHSNSLHLLYQARVCPLFEWLRNVNVHYSDHRYNLQQNFLFNW